MSEIKPLRSMNEYQPLRFFAICLVLAIAINAGFTYWQVTGSQHRWCSALHTITEHPVPKPADPSVNPSRQQTYVLYQEFVGIREGFGCG